MATAAILFVAFMLGWFCSWLFYRLARVTQSDMSDLDKMAHDMHEAEEQRDQAIAYLHHREAEMATLQAETEAELQAAMDGLRSARQEAEELRDHIERRSRGG